MKKEVIKVPGLKTPLGEDGKPLVPISMATRAGDFIFVSGIPPLDYNTGELVQGDILVQTRKSLENIQTILEAAGSSLANVVKTTVYAANAGYYHQINGVYREFFAEDPPARTFVTVGAWPMPFDIEIECVAIG